MVTAQVPHGAVLGSCSSDAAHATTMERTRARERPLEEPLVAQRGELRAQCLHPCCLLRSRLRCVRTGIDDLLFQPLPQTVQHIMEPMLRPER
eukprot:3881335-Lingulodinium_polyedra.AAC.1